ncbi:cytidylate kinase [Catalinimonas alkaloidigena]|uniref:Cytidylate kinase n=1 Tax=Catalinimonas alkaloidigena TaxID=1075417 RepID=A0A1G9GNC5_9BACT|nr:(d)CMP kinase [Catalinimonas alkaloidigena]SDL02191.1 cytidylate kinase [Catalinimonas alkaloidigena]
MHKITVAIDGYSGCGKSTTARLVADALQYTYLDTGAMYRAVTHYFLENHVDWNDADAVAAALPRIRVSFGERRADGGRDTLLNGANVEDAIRSMAVSSKVSEVSAVPAVRRFLVAQQQQIGQAKGVVAEGRDMGTHVFPEAELKVFVTADMDVRAERRQAELQAKGQDVSLQEIRDNLTHRDRIDTSRDDTPLRQADDAEVLDTTHLTIPQQVAWVVERARTRMHDGKE